MRDVFEPVDAFDHRLALGAVGELAELNQAGVLTAADVHVATRVAQLGGETDSSVVLAVALLVRAVRQGSVCLDLSRVAELDPDRTWPEPVGWLAAVNASPLTGTALRSKAGLLYLDRYWHQEGDVVEDLLARVTRSAPAVDGTRLSAGLDRLFPGDSYAEQRQAASDSARRWTSVITGGPGTGKTTTLARLLAVLVDLSEGPLRIALAAPTGKAAARMTQALVEATRADDFPLADRAAIDGLEASTLHRLLGSRPDNATRFRHHRGNRLPHDVVVVDETSMISLTLMARLVEAVRPDARLILVGDSDQLASVEAGAVLQDVVRGFADRNPSPVSHLVTSHRFGDRIGALAGAVRDDDPDRAWDLLSAGSENIELVDPTDDARITELMAGPAIRARERARAGDARGALDALEAHRLLCAHRLGPFGVARWNERIERWLAEHDGRDWLPARYAGEPLIVNSNDYGLRLWNGDTGVVVGEDDGDRAAVFDVGGTIRTIALSRLADVGTAHAITVHRSQGSQFGEVTVLLPEPDSLILTRELLYTALTRATDVVRVVGTEESFRAAIGRPAQRASGLAARLAR